MGVKYGYELDKNGRPIEIMTEYVDDGLELIFDMYNLTDYEQIEYETAAPPAYKVPADLLDEDDTKEEADVYDLYDEDNKIWIAALFLSLMNGKFLSSI